MLKKTNRDTIQDYQSQKKSSKKITPWWDDRTNLEDKYFRRKGGVIFLAVADFHQRPTAENVKEVARGVQESLWIAHDHGIVHCDIRETNVR